MMKVGIGALYQMLAVFFLLICFYVSDIKHQMNTTPVLDLYLEGH